MMGCIMEKEKNAETTSGAETTRPKNVEEKLEQLETAEAEESRETGDEVVDEGRGNTDQGGNGEGNDPASRTELRGAGPEPDKDDEIQSGEIQGLSESAQKKVNERIHDINIRRKNAEAELEQTKGELETLKTGLDDSMRQTIKRIGLRPEYLGQDEIKKVERCRDLQEYRKWLRLHPDGYEGKGDKDPGISAQEVREQLTDVEDELAEIMPEARELERKHDKLLMADAEMGRKLRLAKEKGGKKTVTRPPAMPQASATRRPVVSARQDKKPAFDKGEFEKDGANSTAFRKQYGKLF